MLNIVLSVGFFIALGVVWRFAKPNGNTAESMRKPIVALVQWALLPLVVFFIMQDLPLNERDVRVVSYVAATTLIALAIAWFWLRRTKLPPKIKGAFLIAAAFGNVLFIGLPLNNAMFVPWTMRIAIEYMLVANVVLLYTVGAILAKNLSEVGKTPLGKSASFVLKDYSVWLKEPVIWAALIGLIFNVAGIGIPTWAGQIETMLYGALIPLLLLAVGLALNWTKNWNGQLVNLFRIVLPIAAIQLIIVPVVMWGMVSLFGGAGTKTDMALLLDSMLPATLFGFVMCERYKLDSGAYALAFTVTSVLALVTVPILYSVIA